MINSRPIVRISMMAALVMAAACIVFRFIYLGRPLSYDELYTVASSAPNLSLVFIIKEILMLDINAPLYNILMYFWNLLVNPVTEISIRMPGAIASVATLAYAWCFFPKSLSKLQHIIFFTLLACSHNAIYYAQDARVYSFLILAATILTFEGVNFAEAFKNAKTVPFKKYLFFFGLGLILCYLHYFGAALFFTTAGILFCYAWYYKRPKAVIFIGSVIVFLCFLPWMYHIFTANPNIGEEWWASMPPIRASEQILQMLFGNLIFAYIILCISTLGLVSGLKIHGKKFLNNPALIVPLGAVLIIAVFALIAQVYVNLLVDRYFLVLLPCLLLAISVFFKSIIDRHAPLALLLPASLVIAVSVSTVDFVFSKEKYLAGTRAATQHIIRDIRPAKFFVYLEGIPYPAPALQEMFNFYIKQEKASITQEKLSAENLKEILANKQPVIVLVPVCSKLSLLNMVATFELFPVEVVSFNLDSCVVRAVPLEDLKDE